MNFPIFVTNLMRMWQRVQTLYIGIATALIVSLFFCNFARIIGPEGDEVTIRYSEKLLYLLVLIMLFTANVIALFSFKNRILQMRVCVLAAILLFAFQILVAVDVIRNMHDMVFSFTAVFPLVAVILDIMAARGIMMDEMMVKTASSLRSARKKRGRS